MTSPLPHDDVVAAAAGRLEAAEDATDQERLRALDELYAGLEAELEREMALPHSAEPRDTALPHSAEPRDLGQAGPAGR